MPSLVGQGPVGTAGPTSVALTHTTPPPGNLGARARDAEGNEYVLCSSSATVAQGQLVMIDAAFDVSALVVGTGRGRVGVVSAAGATSDQLCWVQIYGACTMQIGMGGVSPSDAANGPTTLSTSITTRFIVPTTLSTPAAPGWVSDNSSLAVNFYIDNIFVATDADLTAVTAVTLAATHTGHQVKVFLDYPSIRYINYGA